MFSHTLTQSLRILLLSLLGSLFILLIQPVEAAAATYYVKATGNDSADGKSDATAWKTVNKVNSFKFMTGDDVYFRAGDVWSGTQLEIDWAGVSGDRAIVGSYHMNGGTETVGVPNGTNKPTIQGGYTTKGVRGNVPSSQWGGLIVVQGSYVTIQNLRAIDSSGYGITIGKNNDYCIIENTESHHHIGANYFVFDGSDYAILRNNKGTQANRKTTDKVLMADGSKIYGSHPPAMGFNNSQNSLAENNQISNAPAEGITFRIGTRNSIMRGNLIADLPLVGLYIQGGYNNIIENNLLVNSGGINVITESSGKGFEATDIIIRNNLLSGTGGCLATAVWPEAQALGSVTSGKFIGNTCIAPKATAIRFGQGTPASFDSWEIANNIIYDAGQGTGLCTALTDGDIRMHHNSWPTKPSDSDCNGTGDVYGDPKLAKSTGWSNTSIKNVPAPTDFAPQAGSPVINQGTPLSDLPRDYFGTLRANPPTIGALEYGSVAPSGYEPPNIFLPPSDPYVPPTGGGTGASGGASTDTVSLTGSAPTQQITTFSVSKPTSASTANVTITVHDGDRGNEGVMWINNKSVRVLFGRAADPANDGVTKDFSFSVPASSLYDGANSFIFKHRSGDGYTVEKVEVSF